MIQGLIYPVPDPKFPFLGVHLTSMIDGGVEAGPNAVLALSREGYSKWDVRPSDVWEQVTFKGFWIMASKYWKMGLWETARSFSKKAFLRSLQRLVPDLQMKDLTTGGSGVRAQIVTREGKLLDDFCIETHERGIHVLNAPSPGATASLSIGDQLATLIMKRREQ